MKKHNLFIVEDAAEAHGATYDGKKVGSFSDIASFSFFANKNLTTGEGGMVVMKDEKYYDKCRYLKNMSFPINGPRIYQHNDIGFNYRMSNIIAGIVRGQLPYAEKHKLQNHTERAPRQIKFWRDALLLCVIYIPHSIYNTWIFRFSPCSVQHPECGIPSFQSAFSHQQQDVCLFRWLQQP